MSIAEDLEKAEHHLALALSKMLPYAGSGKELASGKRWFGSWHEVKKTAQAMLRARALAERLRYLETPRKRSSEATNDSV
jgi:hypothetical protein